MKLSVNRAELADAVLTAASVAPTRTPKEILKHVLMEVHDDHMLLQATDLDIAVRLSVSQVEVSSPGAVLVSAEKLGQVVRESEDEVLTLETGESVCHVRGQDSHFQIFSHDPKGFPVVPVVDDACDFDLKITELQELTNWTVFAAARENTRYAINGVLWETKGTTLSMVATDGRRLSKADCAVHDGSPPDRSVIVPTKAMQLLGRVFSEQDDTASVKMLPNQLLVKSSRATVTTSLLEGNFPKYQDVVPQDCDKKVVFDAHELLSAVRRAALLTNEESKGVRLAFSRDSLTLTSRAPDQGEALISIPIHYRDSDVAIGFNPVFIIDVLRAVSGEEVAFEFKEPNRPGLFRVGDSRLYVVMPVNLS